MAQATSPSLSLQDGGPPHDHRSANRMKSDSDVPIDPSIAQQTSPAYPPPYSPYNAQGPHEMPHYPNQPPPGMYRPNPPEWPPQYGHSHGMPGQYSAPGPNVSSASPATAGSRSGQVCSNSLNLGGFVLGRVFLFTLKEVVHLVNALMADARFLSVGVLLRSHPGRAAAQATASPL